MRNLTLFLSILIVSLFVLLSVKPVSKKSDEYNLTKHYLDSLSNQLILTQNNLEFVANQKDTDLYRLLRINSDTISCIPHDSIQNIQDKDLKVYSNRVKHRIDSVNKLISLIQKEKYHFRNKAYRRIDSLKHTPSIKPISNADVVGITSRFGNRIDKNKVEFHEGVDFAVVENSPIYATADGVVELVWKDKEGYGFRIVINHYYGYRTVYAHLLKFCVKEKQFVKKGQLIAKSGNTGHSLGPHLHYEVHKNNVFVNPLKYMVINDFIGDKND